MEQIFFEKKIADATFTGFLHKMKKMPHMPFLGQPRAGESSTADLCEPRGGQWTLERKRNSAAKKRKQKSGWPNKNPRLRRRWLKAENGIYTDVRHELLLHAAPTSFFSWGKGLYSIMQTQFSFSPVPSFLNGKILPPPLLRPSSLFFYFAVTFLINQVLHLRICVLPKKGLVQVSLLFCIFMKSPALFFKKNHGCSAFII